MSAGQTGISCIQVLPERFKKLQLCLNFLFGSGFGEHSVPFLSGKRGEANSAAITYAFSDTSRAAPCLRLPFTGPHNLSLSHLRTADLYFIHIESGPVLEVPDLTRFVSMTRP